MVISVKMVYFILDKQSGVTVTPLMVGSQPVL